jgi:hypothetical protein
VHGAFEREPRFFITLRQAQGDSSIQFLVGKYQIIPGLAADDELGSDVEGLVVEDIGEGSLYLVIGQLYGYRLIGQVEQHQYLPVFLPAYKRKYLPILRSLYTLWLGAMYIAQCRVLFAQLVQYSIEVMQLVVATPFNRVFVEEFQSFQVGQLLATIDEWYSFPGGVECCKAVAAPLYFSYSVPFQLFSSWLAVKNNG